MMMTFDSVRQNLIKSLDKYRMVSLVDASLASNKTDGYNTYEPDKSSNQDAWGYNTKKLNPIIRQKKQEYDLMATALQELANTGTLSTQTIKTENTLEGTQNTYSTEPNDDGAKTIKKSTGDLLVDLGVADLVNDKDISTEKKKQLATAYLKELTNIKEKIKDDSLLPNFEVSQSESYEAAKQELTQYAKLKETYVTAIKKAQNEGSIQLTNKDGSEMDTITKAKYEQISPNQSLDFSIKAITSDGSQVSAEDKAKVDKLTKVKDQLDKQWDTLRKKFETAGLGDYTKTLLDEKTFQPSDELIKKIDEVNKGNDYASTKDKNEARTKFGEAFKNSTTKADGWKPLAKAVKDTLQQQRIENQNTNTIGISLKNFDALLNNQSAMAVVLDAYKAKSVPAEITVDSILNEPTVADTPAEQAAQSKASAETEEKNRETALKNIKPIIITSNRDRGKANVGVITVKGKFKDHPVDVRLSDDQIPITVVGDSTLLTSNFRGQPAVFFKENGKVYMQFYNRPDYGTGYVLSTGIVEVDPKLAFEEDGKTPKPEIEVSMLKADKAGRKVIDYYIRGFTKEGKTNENKVYYVARNFADDIDRLPAIREAESLAAIDADPVNYKTGAQLKQAKVQKEEDAKPSDLSESAIIPNKQPLS